VDDVAHKLLLLKATFPEANVSRLCTECTHILLLELPQFAEAVQQASQSIALQASAYMRLSAVCMSNADVHCTCMQQVNSIVQT
jgi:hypothetical protein